MAIDAGKCMNCKACVVACQQRNATPYGLFRNWVRESPLPGSPNGMGYQPGACMHCDKPLCVEACPTQATYKAQDGSVRIDANRCIGCGGCIAACPYDARFKNPRTGVADKCDYCQGATGAAGAFGILGLSLPPACVLACPSHCRVFGDADNPDDPVAKLLATSKPLRVVAAECDTKPTLAYVNTRTPTDWPRPARVPGPLAAMSFASLAVKWLGGLALFGVLGVFLKNLAFPAGEEEHKGERV
jgi:Fe-S-cluster-containing dehydrogenase component